MNITVANVGVKYVMVNESAFVDPNALAPTCAALARQLNEQFALAPPFGYGIGCAGLRLATPDAKPQPGEAVILLTDKVDAPGALAYHSITDAGDPILHVFPKLDAQDGVAWSTSTSHEALETNGDFDCGGAEIGDDGVIRAREVCDPVENDSYLIDGIAVSDFVLLGYFGTEPAATKFDFMGLLKAPGELRPGGYQSVFANGVWSQLQNGQKRGGRRFMDEHGIGRGPRRKARLHRIR